MKPETVHNVEAQGFSKLQLLGYAVPVGKVYSTGEPCTVLTAQSTLRKFVAIANSVYEFNYNVSHMRKA